MIEVIDNQISCTEIKHWDCTPEMFCPSAVADEQTEQELLKLEYMGIAAHEWGV
jgi:hypothetical protein